MGRFSRDARSQNCVNRDRALNSPSIVLLYVHRGRTDYYGRSGPGRPPRLSHSSWPVSELFECNAALHPQRPYGLSLYQDVHLDFHTAHDLWVSCSSAMLLYIHRDRTDYRFIRTSTSTFTQLMTSEWAVRVQCCFTSTETVRTIALSGRPPRLSHSSWPLSELFECNAALHPQRPYGLSLYQDVHLDFHTAHDLWVSCSSAMLLYIHRDRTDYRFIRTSTSIFTQLLSSPSLINLSVGFLWTSSITEDPPCPPTTTHPHPAVSSSF